MTISFRELYNDIVALERGVEQLELDLENASCDYATKCILEDELFRLQHKVASLYNLDLDFANLDFVSIMSKVGECLPCVDIGVTEELLM